METFGEYLRGQREKKGIRLEEIASITKIHLHSLQYLERGSWTNLPPEPFIRGFIIAYAKYVGLEPKDVLERYALEHGKSSTQAYETGVVSTTDTSEIPAPPTATESADRVLNSPRTFPIRKTAFASLGIVALIVVAVLVSLGKEKSEPQAAVEIKESAPVAEATADRAVTSTAELPAAAPIEEIKPAPPEFPHELSLETKERSWAKIVIDDKAPVEFYSVPGKKTTFQAKEKIKLVLGISVGSTVAYNGETAEGKKVVGAIRYYVFPNGSRFPQDIPKRKEASESENKDGGGDPSQPAVTD